ncbi:MAG TPA: D-alanyl-D-alanine carboxypeptidase family protein [Gammaproteobacteria bacterium]
MTRRRSATLTLLSCVLLAAPARADDASAAAPRVQAKSYILIDYATGTTLAESNADEPLPIASLTKLMTAYVVFEALRDGRIALDDQVLVSEKAWRMRGSRMFIEVNTHVAVEDLILGLIVQSGNDASVALAEHVAGSVPAFVELMNAAAERLGMTRTTYANTHGLPAPGAASTARDQAILARALIAEFPEYYPWYSLREFTYNGIRQYNRNRLLARDPSVDGLKTGHTNAAGYCLVSSAQRDGMRVISVVLGADTPAARAASSQSLIDWGFATYETHRLFAAGEEIVAERVWRGSPELTSLGVAEDFYVTIPRGRFDALAAEVKLPLRLVAPLERLAPVGEVHVSFDGRPLASAPLVALGAVAQGGPWTRLRDEFMLLLE